jgi:hypothetical protein
VSAKFAFIDAEKALYSIVKMCAWIGVSTSGYYEWRDRPPSATAQRRNHLATLIEWIFTDSDQTYGHRRIRAALARQGEHVTPELDRAIMRERGLNPCQPRPFRPTTTVAGDAGSIPDLVARDFTADAPGTKLVGDITYYAQFRIMPTSAGSMLVSGASRANLVGIIPGSVRLFPRGAGGGAVMDRAPGGSGVIVPLSTSPTHIYQRIDRPSKNTEPNRTAESRPAPGRYRSSVQLLAFLGAPGLCGPIQPGTTFAVPLVGGRPGCGSG